MRVVSLAGDDPVWSTALVVVACGILLALSAKREAATLLGVVLVGQVLKIGIKHLVGRPRPHLLTPECVSECVNVLIDSKEIHSFPSGHTVHYVVFFGFLCFATFMLVKPQALRWALLGIFGGIVGLIGLARIYLGAHWISDILGGYLLGGAVLLAGIDLYRRRARRPARTEKYPGSSIVGKEIKP